MKNINILVFPCGSEISMEIHRALSKNKEITLFGGSSVDDHGKYVYKNYIEGIPNISEEDFVYALNKILIKHEIDYIYPAHDDVVLKLSQHKDDLKAIALVADVETCEIGRSKKKTYSYFSSENYIPKTYNEYIDNDEMAFPVFLKPDIGQGSQGVQRANNSSELEYYLEQDSSLVISEYLPGEEYTIDCFTGENNVLKHASQRKRNRIKAGISVNSGTVDLDVEIEKIAKSLNEKMSFKGAWFFQVKKDSEGMYKLLEFAPRIAGTMGTSRSQGVNFPLLTLYLFMGRPTNILKTGKHITLDRAFINRFVYENSKYDYIYVDFDDTIIINNNVNTEMMMFLYQAKNQGKEIYLITKHVFDIHDSLKKYNICEGLFTEIIHLDKKESKHRYIKKDKEAIFIDDSFSERKEVFDNTGISTYDLDLVETLIDWRE